MTAHAFTKVYRSITQSTVWVGQPAHVKLSWIVLLAEADEIGRVTTPVPVLAKLAEVTLQEFEEALRVFLSPDPYSRSKEFDGRRIEALDGEEEFGGFRILNHEKYRKKRDLERRRQQNREAQDRWREAHPKESRKPEVSHGVSESKQDKPPSAEVSHKKPIPSASPSVEAEPTSTLGDPAVLPAELDPRPDRDPARGGKPKPKGRGGRAGDLVSIPDGWAPNDHHRELAKKLDVSLRSVEAEFRDRTKSKGTRYVDWDAGFCTWLRNARKFADQRGEETHADDESTPRPGLTPEQIQSAIARDQAKQRAWLEAQSAPTQSSLVSPDGAIDFAKMGGDKIMRHARRQS